MGVGGGSLSLWKFSRIDVQTFHGMECLQMVCRSFLFTCCFTSTQATYGLLRAGRGCRSRGGSGFNLSQHTAARQSGWNYKPKRSTRETVTLYPTVPNQRFLVPSRCSAAAVKVNMVLNVHKLIRDGDHQNDSCIKAGSDETILMFH